MLTRTTSQISRRAALGGLAAAGLTMPAAFRVHAAAPSETLYHASFGASGMARGRPAFAHGQPSCQARRRGRRRSAQHGRDQEGFPDVKVYQDWRELLDKEKHLDSVNVSTPDHMHAPITMRAMQRGLNVYTQKPLTQTIYEARQLTRTAREKKLVTQMGIQIHSHEIHRTVVATIQGNAIGKVKEVHSWSGKYWGDPEPQARPQRPRARRAELGFLAGRGRERPFIAGYYHPGEWRKRLDFGTGTFGDMGCHILDPVFTSLALTAPDVASGPKAGVPTKDNWGLDTQVRYVFPEHEVHDRVAHALLVRRRQAAPGADQGPDRRAAALRPGLDLHRHRGRALLSVHRVSRAAARRAVQGATSSPTPAAPTTTSSSSKPAVATAKRRPRSTTRARSPSRSCWAAWPPGSPRRPWNGMRRS